MMNQRQKDALDKWLTTPPDDDRNYECPFCGAAVEQDDDGWKCTSEDCDWSSYPNYDEEN